jgi:DNA-binding transcriptional ArsR family regulator
MTEQRSVVELTDARAVLAYAHPIRLQLVGLLRREGPLTASEAGRLLGESSGSTSYHLRQLARYGLVEETGEGQGRTKPWRATAMFTNLPSATESPELAAASTHLKTVLARRYLQLTMQWLQHSAEDDPAWQRAAPFGDSMVYLTAAELAEVVNSVEQQLLRYADRLTDPGKRPADARLVTYLHLAFPLALFE